ncbi:MAG: HAMP domain-containing protein [Anaerolineales bacterium]|nr:HAMP domain-containing protein [Anaerolineales bacterium]
MRLFQSLQWKLTFSYTLVTVLAVLIAVGLPLLFLLPSVRAGLFSSLNSSMTEGVSAVAGDLGQYFQTNPPNALSLQKHIQERFGSEMLLQTAFQIVVVDADQRLLAAWPLEANLNLGENFTGEGYPWLSDFIPRALKGERTSGSLYDQQFSAAMPITNQSGQVVGALAMAGSWPGSDEFFWLLGTVLILLLIAVALVVGTAFGWLASRGLTRRLNAVMHTTQAWGQGDFSQTIHDASGDEIGQLSQRLNSMAEALQGILQTKQALAATEERNRLARELHDSVKQQIFATTMQLGAARELLERDPQAAKKHLADAEQLATTAREELTGLIRELRPAALDGRGLAEALREYVADWSRRTQIQSDVRVRGERSVPLETEQTLFRVAQEALANVARHSHANHVAVELIYTNTSVALGIGDNGIGFETESVKPKSVGLASMRERMEALGGYLQVVSRPNAGTHIVASCQHTQPNA